PLFKRTDKVNEPAFHDIVFRELYRSFGDDIIDEDRVAGGVLDIYALKTPLELKVEKKIQDKNLIFKKYKDQLIDYCYKKNSKIGILCVYENSKKGPGYSKDDIGIFKEEDINCVILIFRGNFPYSSKI
ncbi:unnamed protein product, partial [marine sediment metagenome]